ncbi:MAG: hypothetical protein CMM15_10900 [Rhodospirillaceae bacterium]|nr:hypothetical protein [Rhodospirillaceae bacterium]OUX67862.1 MAG: hypothetical protein CBD38_01155 [bacterium TMED178]|tara:strand:+ start:4133 stop:7261 length:3129 start_codon:yes stop_codon:yes gene_type:complete
MVFVRQTNPDFYTAKVPEKERRQNLNPRYPYFKQNYFTAGDFDQFIKNWKVLKNMPKEKDVHPSVDIPFQADWSKYKNLCVHDYYNTFLYIFEKFKKGCFLQIHDNTLKTFLPFSKQSFQNEWGKHLQIDPRFQTIQRMMKYIATHDTTFPFDEKRINGDLSSWYGNNGLVRFEYPLSENDTGYNMLKDMFECLVRERKLPDIDFYLGKRDYPWLTLNGDESYDAFFGQKRLISHNYRNYAPILSMNTTDKHADIPIPTWEDWRRVAYQSEKKIFSRDFLTYPSNEAFESIRWADKKPTIVFRGASTGRGTTVHNNPRLFFSTLSMEELVDENDIPLLDVGINKWNMRPRKAVDSKYLTTFYKETLTIPVLDYMDPFEQSKYKYILHLPGHTAAYRLSLEMFYGSVIFIYPSSNYLWFYKMLKPWKHYIPLEEELSKDDLLTKLKWCREHDREAEEIANNAREFAKKYLSREGILNYLQALFWKLYEGNVSLAYSEAGIFGFQKQYIDTYLQRRQHVLYEKPIVFLTDLFEDAMTKNNHSIQLASGNPIFMSYLFHYLYHHRHLSGFLQKHVTNKNFINSKNSDLSLYRFHNSTWIGKQVKSTWKEDQYHQLFIGYRTMNELALRLPNFMYTYYACHTLNTTDSHIHIFVEYKDCLTLEQMIRQKKIAFHDLITIWAHLCLILEEAQLHSGFIHMDLYPWNILIEEKETTAVYLQKYKFSTKFNPILIDYGNSHIVHGGHHFYTTTPFHFNRLQDIISIVFSSLDIFLHTSVLKHQDVQKCIQIMNFFSGSCMFPNEKFSSIGQIKQFVKKNKKFSAMLSSPKTSFRESRPIFFLQYLRKLQHVPSFEVLKQRPKIVFVPYDGPLVHHFNLLYILQTLLVGQVDIPPEDFAIWLRRMWDLFFEDVRNYDIEVDYKYFFIHIQNYMKFYAVVENKLQKLFNILVWKTPKQLGQEAIIDNASLSKDEIEKIQKKVMACTMRPRTFPNLPILPTHNCAKCDTTWQKCNSEYYQNVEYLFDLKTWYFSTRLDDVDFFQLKTYDVGL